MQSFDEFVFIVFFCFAIGFFFWKHNGTDNESLKTSMITFYCDFWKAKTFGRRYKKFFRKSQSSYKHLTLRKIKKERKRKNETFGGFAR